MANQTKPRLPGELLTIAGMIFNSIAVTLLIKADFGISAISSVPYVFSEYEVAGQAGITAPDHGSKSSSPAA